jgi:type II secretory pathway pseudopilin PulG
MRQLWTEEAGFTLVELLITFVLMVVILVAISGVLVSAQRQAPNDVLRAQVIGQAQAGIAQMDRDLRAGWAPTGSSLPTSATNVMDLDVPSSTYGTIRVKYDCTVASVAYPGKHECVRYWSATTTSSPTTNAQLVIDDLSNDETTTDAGYTPVFTPNSSTSPTEYTVKIQLPAAGGRASSIDSYTYQVTLTDGVYLRNATPTNRATGGQ